MSELPVISGLDAVKAFERAGRRVARQKGSYIILVKKDEMVSPSIPNHKTLDRGTLRSLIRKAGISVDGFMRFL